MLTVAFHPNQSNSSARLGAGLRSSDLNVSLISGCSMAASCTTGMHN
jgi:hypothetical protein